MLIERSIDDKKEPCMCFLLECKNTIIKETYEKFGVVYFVNAYKDLSSDVSNYIMDIFIKSKEWDGDETLEECKAFKISLKMWYKFISKRHPENVRDAINKLYNHFKEHLHPDIYRNTFAEVYDDIFPELPEQVLLKDSGNRTEFGTGAVRDLGEGKGRFDLLPACALLRLAKHFEKGAKKYSDRNWEKGIPISSFMDSAFRHLVKYMDGQMDEDHLVAACWNVICAMWTEEKHPEMQNIPAILTQLRGIDQDKEE